MAVQTTLIFAGATGTVTGSHFILESGDTRLLLDCGLYQGPREWRERNWQPFLVPPASIDALVLSHAHIDHTGYYPRLRRDGFRGPACTSAATRDLCAILLPDSARLMEEEAEYRNRKGATRFHPALPLYTEAEAERAATELKPVPFGARTALPGGAALVLRRAGHLLGSALVQVHLNGLDILFSGDLGRRDPLLFAPPDAVPQADYLLLESTYGGREHEERDPSRALERAVQGVVERRGVLVIPAFAVGRTQEVLFLLRELEDAGRIPALPVAVDSPMATDATALYMRYESELAPDVRRFGDRAFRPRHLRFTPTVQQSKALNDDRGPGIVISASGMATGGRVLHHLSRRLPDARNAVLLVGYQAEGTRGRALQDGAPTVRIFGDDVPVRAPITSVDALSSHADATELLGWLRNFQRPPRHTFLVHGEDQARAALAERIRGELGWDVHAAAFGERVTLT